MWSSLGGKSFTNTVSSLVRLHRKPSTVVFCESIISITWTTCQQSFNAAPRDVWSSPSRHSSRHSWKPGQLWSIWGSLCLDQKTSPLGELVTWRMCQCKKLLQEAMKDYLSFCGSASELRCILESFVQWDVKLEYLDSYRAKCLSPFLPYPTPLGSTDISGADFGFVIGARTIVFCGRAHCFEAEKKRGQSLPSSGGDGESCHLYKGPFAVAMLMIFKSCCMPVHVKGDGRGARDYYLWS